MGDFIMKKKKAIAFFSFLLLAFSLPSSVHAISNDSNYQTGSIVDAVIHDASATIESVEVHTNVQAQLVETKEQLERAVSRLEEAKEEATPGEIAQIDALISTANDLIAQINDLLGE